jgi:hypothetical protein
MVLQKHKMNSSDPVAELLAMMPEPKKLSASAKPYYPAPIVDLSMKLNITLDCANALLDVLQKMKQSED